MKPERSLVFLTGNRIIPMGFVRWCKISIPRQLISSCHLVSRVEFQETSTNRNRSSTVEIIAGGWKSTSSRFQIFGLGGSVEIDLPPFSKEMICFGGSSGLQAPNLEVNIGLIMITKYHQVLSRVFGVQYNSQLWLRPAQPSPPKSTAAKPLGNIFLSRKLVDFRPK